MSHREMIIALAALAGAALVSALGIRGIYPLLVRYALARPNARSSHKVPTPQGAGMAVLAATLGVAGCLAAMVSTPVPAFWVLFFASLVIAVVGAIDDLRPMPVGPRLLLQALCIAAILVVLPTQQQLAPQLSLWIERAVLLIAALWFVNLVNFMDGLDWMTVAEVVPVTGALLLMGLAGLLPLPTTILAAALCGAMLGFAPFNRPVAKMFLGDVGSLPIGLLLAWCFLQLTYSGHLAAAILLPLYYLADATVTLLRRMVRREPFWLAHRSHFYQRATDNGYTVMQVVRLVFAVNIGLAALAGVSIHTASTLADVGLLAAGAVMVGYLLKVFAKPNGRLQA